MSVHYFGPHVASVSAPLTPAEERAEMRRAILAMAERLEDLEASTDQLAQYAGDVARAHNALSDEVEDLKGRLTSAEAYARALTSLIGDLREGRV